VRLDGQLIFCGAAGKQLGSLARDIDLQTFTGVCRGGVAVHELLDEFHFQGR